MFQHPDSSQHDKVCHATILLSPWIFQNWDLGDFRMQFHGRILELPLDFIILYIVIKKIQDPININVNNISIIFAYELIQKYVTDSL